MREGPLDADRRWSNRPLVRETDRRSTLWLWRTLCGLVVAMLPVLVYLVLQNECLKIEYEISGLRSEIERLELEEQSLAVERARLEALPRVESWALQRGGLLRPSADAVVVVSKSLPGTDGLLARETRRDPSATR